MTNAGSDTGVPGMQPPNALGDNAWQPVEGAEIRTLLDNHVAEESRANVGQEACYVLSHCLPPTDRHGQETGLVVGYVQSGKTLSFTAVSALARDNGYRMIIAITGTSVNLFEQSRARLRSDLGLNTDRWPRRWKEFANPRTDTDRRRIEAALERWRDPGVNEEERQTILVVVMKHHTYLNDLVRLLSQLQLNDVPMLVIDDEADQAGLNTKVRQGDQSTTYDCLVRLRACLPSHTFLQYTATPQAPLLINIIDILSPSFAKVLTPGPAYTGGTVFFEQNLQLVRRIPDPDIPSNNNVLNAPPDSLIEAMRCFFLGVAAGLIMGPPPRNRSMMIHPSQRTFQHGNYYHWVTNVMSAWQSVLTSGQDSPDRIELLQDFHQEYDDLSGTVHNLPPFDDLVRILPRAIRETIPHEVNSTSGGRTPNIEWDADYSHILVGGQALDRGYTVEGLTVTYMPRGQGVGNADTIQQRARWFGYKADYLGYCRVYLAGQTLTAYQSYVEHEEDIRQRLRTHTGSLRDWRRAFFISPGLRPTRNNVMDLDYMRGNFINGWYEQRAPHDSQEGIADNRCLIQGFVSSLRLATSGGDTRRLPTHIHLVQSDVSVAHLYNNLLTQVRMSSPGDSARFTGLLLQIQRFLETNPEATSTVYMMRPNPGEILHRSLNTNDEIPNLMQGAYPVDSKDIYPGDRQIHSATDLTVQLHMFGEIRRDGQVVARDVPAIAVWVPRSMSAPWLIQDQV